MSYIEILGGKCRVYYEVKNKTSSDCKDGFSFYAVQHDCHDYDRECAIWNDEDQHEVLFHGEARSYGIMSMWMGSEETYNENCLRHPDVESIAVIFCAIAELEKKYCTKY